MKVKQKIILREANLFREHHIRTERIIEIVRRKGGLLRRLASNYVREVK